MIVIRSSAGQGFKMVYESLRRMISRARVCDTTSWQGVDVSRDPSARCHEIVGVEIEIDLGGVEDMDHWRKDIAPNLPWADHHFDERVGGHPLNPGQEWSNWPWSDSADKFRVDGRFNHTYAERFWPKYARQTPGGILDGKDFFRSPRRGIGWTYGDLDDLVDLLVKDPSTRQAWIPLFFPEDTGIGDGGRKPCTLGYQILVRDGRMSIWYPLRSCDIARHFRDDCYLAVRLMMWILGKCRDRDPARWGSVQPGSYGMHCTSLHVFENDWIKICKEVSHGFV